ncbi:S8 family serine peptidase [Alistipes megaguti]|uniref:S8 family serine peptidase n=1 Tax=Alistipes megaguti TaxID=2364787 RepID=UPI0030811297
MYLVSALSVVALFAFHACSTEDLVEPSASNTQSEPTEMSGEVIVKFDPAVSDLLDERGLAQTRSNAAATRSGIYSVDEVLDMLGEVQAATPNRTIKRAYRTDRKPIPFPKELLNAPATRAEGENGYVYNDQLLKWEWHMINRGYQDHFTIDPEEDAEVAKAKFQVGADVNCEKAWERTTGDPSIIVAVLDEGIYFRHPDLQYNMWENEGETYGSHKDNDGNGYVGDYYGYDFINNTGIISCDNSADTGHGTHVAGVIAARNNNGIGITSIAGGTEENPGVKIMSCQIFSGNTSSNTVSLARAIKYAADNGAVILQCSWGYTSSTANGYENTPGFATQEEWETNCPLEKASLDYFVHNAGSPNGPIEGGIPVFASGNESAPSAGFPGAADYCVSVNAIAADYTISTFSNYGPGSNISAPGGDQDYYFDYIGSESSDPAYTAARGAVGCVLSTMPPQVSDQTGYGYMEGTSMACPTYRVSPRWVSPTPSSCASTSPPPSSANCSSKALPRSTTTRLGTRTITTM